MFLDNDGKYNEVAIKLLKEYIKENKNEVIEYHLQEIEEIEHYRNAITESNFDINNVAKFCSNMLKKNYPVSPKLDSFVGELKKRTNNNPFDMLKIVEKNFLIIPVTKLVDILILDKDIKILFTLLPLENLEKERIKYSWSVNVLKFINGTEDINSSYDNQPYESAENFVIRKLSERIDIEIYKELSEDFIKINQMLININDENRETKRIYNKYCRELMKKWKTHDWLSIWIHKSDKQINAKIARDSSKKNLSIIKRFLLDIGIKVLLDLNSEKKDYHKLMSYYKPLFSDNHPRKKIKLFSGIEI